MLKRLRDDGEGTPKKQTAKRRRLDVHQDELESSATSTTSNVENCSSALEDVKKTGSKRKADSAGEGSSKKKSRTEKTEIKPQTLKNLSVNEQRGLFKDKYTEEDVLDQGGFGCVFAGYRNEDHLPVAIKHIPKNRLLKIRDQSGKRMSAEVATMSKLSAGAAGSVGTSAAVSLLDWYDLGKELIVVQERPVPAVDLFTYIQRNRGALKEKEARVLMKQLVNAAKELEENNIFHRDIKVENILIETGSDVPRVRLIDFGLSCFFKKRSNFRNFCGTADHIPPELYVLQRYRPGPTTVWQLGIVLFDMLHRTQKFETIQFVGSHQKVKKRLSKNCKDFLRACCATVPTDRPTLEELQNHPWLQ
ncbi:serine/threonine-protein kinase pim-1-like [Cheilinus undulatus]|uniref:serine/threonine-protein kinase pim-1-like n=1 Tax=Cheilinus undulatus TaxID=241271 RepID=UPI001BD28F80|nr:serine/threonine-protein kinase pim-1-like [Cheilinus undulatus]